MVSRIFIILLITLSHTFLFGQAWKVNLKRAESYSQEKKYLHAIREYQNVFVHLFPGTNSDEAFSLSPHLKLREKPNTQSKILKHLGMGFEMKVLKRSKQMGVVGQREDFWYFVEIALDEKNAKSVKGWVFGYYIIRKVHFRQKHIDFFTTSRLNLRKAPSLASDVKMVLKQGQWLDVLGSSSISEVIKGKKGTWVKVKDIENNTGYVFSAYINNYPELWIRPQTDYANFKHILLSQEKCINSFLDQYSARYHADSEVRSFLDMICREIIYVSIEDHSAYYFTGSTYFPWGWINTIYPNNPEKVINYYRQIFNDFPEYGCCGGSEGEMVRTIYDSHWDEISSFITEYPYHEYSQKAWKVMIKEVTHAHEYDKSLREEYNSDLDSPQVKFMLSLVDLNKQYLSKSITWKQLMKTINTLPKP